MGAGGARYKTYPSGVVTKRYAPYIEAYHQTFLEIGYAKIVALDDNPPPKYEMGDKILDAFFGTGYFISAFPALFDMCGKYIAGLDIDNIWVRMFEEVHGQSAIPDASEATTDDERDLWRDEVSALAIEARDSNSIASSSYILAKAQYEREYAIRTSRYRTNLQFLLLDNKAHETYLNAQKKNVTIYAIMMKYFYDIQDQSNKQDYRQEMNQTIWPLTTRNYFTGMLNAMSRAQRNETYIKERIKRSLISKMQYTVSEAIKGAGVGYVIGGWYGAAIGAQIGTAYGEWALLSEQGYRYPQVAFLLGPEGSWMFDEDYRKYTEEIPMYKHLPIFMGPEFWILSQILL